ncbi:hypothetical protein O181_065757 [Austropuccinia psidii MF-1]|uniref:Uncharacterized protein n=1 Tax=Austropuccinia psidii MF-1 TaxID=1389203 RepID=A0A9Q3EU36_9BASI|nr:hypothetical protein [Austropuccinia psidii MF-1]
MQMAFWTTDPRISDAIEAMPGYEEGNWTQLRKDLITKWGRVEPERRYRKESLIQIFNDTRDEGGISTLSEYRKFIGEYETLITYLLRYNYIPQGNMFHEDVFDCLSADIKSAISKEMIKDNVMVRAEDGGYLIPPMRILKKYIEQELEARILVTKRLSSPRIKAVKNESITKENNVKFKEELFPGMQEALKKMKELTKTLKEQQVVANKEVPREKEVSKQFMEQLDELSKIAKPQKIAYDNPQAAYSDQKKIYHQNHQDMCLMHQLKMHQNHLLDDITVQKKDTPQENLSPKQLVREFQKEHEELKKKLEEKAKDGEQKKKEKSTAFITMDNWEDCQPPLISTGREPLGYSYGLRNTKQRRENEDKAKAQSQPLPEREEEEKVIKPTIYKSPRPLGVNKEEEVAIHKNKTPQKQPMDEIKTIIKAPKEDRAVIKPKKEDKEEVPIVEKVINKVLDQKINLTLEEIFTISPRFMNELKFLSDREKKYLMSLKSINNKERV